jgi:hypothetical protein
VAGRSGLAEQVIVRSKSKEGFLTHARWQIDAFPLEGKSLAVAGMLFCLVIKEIWRMKKKIL